MKIEGTGVPGQPRPVPETVPRTMRFATAVSGTTADGSPVSRLATALRDIGADIPEARLATLAAELETIGVSLSRIDAGTALRALFLSNNGVSLTPALLAAEASPASLPRGLAELANAMRTMLADTALPADVRAVFTAFVSDADAWFGTRNDFARLLATSAPTLFSAAGTDAFGEPAVSSAAELAAGGLAADNLRALIRNSGSSFEWRLLAWHRAGADPARLAGLAGSDLKGMLLKLLAVLESLKRKDAGDAVAKLGEKVRSLVDKATAGQIAALLDNTGLQRNAAFNVPFPAFGAGATADVYADGEKESGGDSSGPGGFSFAFAVETANLGAVRAHVRIAKGMLSAVFVLPDEQTKAFAEGMTDEFRAMLAGRGYTQVTVRFAVEGSDDAPDLPASRTQRPLDVSG